MSLSIRELRDSTGMTQKDFSSAYGIPLSTLRKWEQGEASPAPYVLTLLSRCLPCTDASLKKIKADDGSLYYYSENRKTVSDSRGNAIPVREDISGVKEQNLPIYLHDLFDTFYAAQEKFERDCRYDKQEDILWTE